MLVTKEFIEIYIHIGVFHFYIIYNISLLILIGRIVRLKRKCWNVFKAHGKTVGTRGITRSETRKITFEGGDSTG